MKKTLIAITLASMLVSNAYALFDTPGTLPQNLPTAGAFYYGTHDKTFGSLGLTVRLEFAVYEGDQAEIVIEDTGYAGEATDYVYAYQVFCDESSIAPLEYFALTGIASADADISQVAAFDPDAVAPSPDGYFNDSKTRAIWEFGSGALVQGKQSWFLFLYSNDAPIVGDFEVQPLANDDIPTPGVPEPATLALLACGALLSLKRRK